MMVEERGISRLSGCLRKLAFECPARRGGVFTLVTSSGLIGVPLFGYIYGDTKLDRALWGFSISSAVLALLWGFNCRGARRSCRYKSVS
jgi:hypothetical protein